MEKGKDKTKKRKETGQSNKGKSRKENGNEPGGAQEGLRRTEPPERRTWEGGIRTSSVESAPESREGREGERRKGQSVQFAPLS